MIREFGRVLAALACIAGLPVHLCLCVLIKTCDPGPALYRCWRLGKDRVPFGLLKYRTMKVNAPPLITAGLRMIVTQADPRVTRLGRWLRWGLDELPQMWNIVRGEMAWVGPRPDEAWMLPHYGRLIELRLSLIPGITGFAQVLHSRSLSTAESFAIDLWYLSHRSFWLDTWVVLVTPLFMMGNRAIGHARLRQLRNSPEFELLRQRCDAELSSGAFTAPSLAHAAAIAGAPKIESGGLGRDSPLRSHP